MDRGGARGLGGCRGRPSRGGGGRLGRPFDFVLCESVWFGLVGVGRDSGCRGYVGLKVGE